MKNFIFKSSDPDLQKMFSAIETLQKNVLYITHHVDSILNRLNQLVIDKDLQRQANEYFEETSPQTDNEDQEPD